MIKPGEIQKTAARLHLRDTQIEKDYIIGWVLRGISSNDYLRNNLVFKGGTALRKIYFSDYRLSEDLDFTFTGDELKPEEIKSRFAELISFVSDEANIKLSITDDKVHQTGNYNFYLQYTGPLGGAGANKSIKVDIANDEKLCCAPVEKNVCNKYSDLKGDDKVLTYPLGEIIPEKMRSLMQRTTPRDLYDLWYLFETEKHNIEDYISDFKKKAEDKGKDPYDFTAAIAEKEAVFRKAWQKNLDNQMQEIPDFDEVWRTLGKHWKRFEKALK